MPVCTSAAVVTLTLQDEAKRNLPGHVLTFLQDTSAPDQSGYCASTLPSHFASVTHCNSRCIKAPPPGPLPLGERGFLPQVRRQAERSADMFPCCASKFGVCPVLGTSKVMPCQGCNVTNISQWIISSS